jgi:hypothetical protein
MSYEPDTEMVPGFKAKLSPSENLLGYTFTLTEASETSRFSFLTDEKGVIYEGYDIAPVENSPGSSATFQFEGTPLRSLDYSKNNAGWLNRMTAPFRSFASYFVSPLCGTSKTCHCASTCYCACTTYNCFNNCIPACCNIGCVPCVWCCGDCSC